MPPSRTTPRTTIPTPDAAANLPPHRYTARLAGEIEERWQQYWEDHETFRTPNPGEPGFDAAKPKYYVLDMFPYPSGAGLHVGHPEGYTATDIVSRHRRHRGFNVLHPMGWDAFGLPAEQYAIETGVHPVETTKKAIDNFRRQLKRFGFSYDWSREFATIDEDYYRWTQWIWLQAYHSWFDPAANQARPIGVLIHELDEGNGAFQAEGWASWSEEQKRLFIDDNRLAYLAEQTVNWCPALGTVLANEEVIGGRSERGGHPVFRQPLKQWMFRITAYADRLLEDLDDLDWPSSTRTMQKEWIGRSEGAEIDFKLENSKENIRVYTTRPDTVFGATYMVLAPEHPLLDDILAHPAPETNVQTIKSYVEKSRQRTDVDRMADAKEKTGVFTGWCARNAASDELMPIWVADYVLMGYGHGAIMAVPAHDQRDFDFARAFDLPIVDVVHGPALEALREGAIRLADLSDDDELRFDILTDFVALCVNWRGDDYDEAWEIVTRRRNERPKEFREAPGAEPQQRGSISRIWRETLDDFAQSDLGGLIDAAGKWRLIDRTGAALSEPGRSVNSANSEVSLNGLDISEAKKTIIDWLENTDRGRGKVNFKLRDWLFSRQRYWGEPFPVVFDESGRHHPVADSHLPVVLPDLADYEPAQSNTPAPLLAKATDWVHTTADKVGCPDGLSPETPVTRETNTMPGWAGSCWYFLRYCDPRNKARLVSKLAEQYWMGTGKEGGVDLYIGGAEHAVLHLLYARFWHKLLYDLGEVSTPEPFQKLFHQGMITSHAYQRPDKSLVPVDEVEEVAEGKFVESVTGETVTPVVAKMSKSLKNVINPDEVIAEYGADTFRLYEMALGPLEQSKPWNTRDIVGVFRFLQRAWRLVVDEETGELRLRDKQDAGVEKRLHRTIDKVDGDIDRLAFNTAIAAMIEFVNEATASGGLTADQLDRFIIVLSPFAPHLAEELWSRRGYEATLAYVPWPEVDPAQLREDEIEMPVQIMGRVRGHITVPADADSRQVEEMALDEERIRELLKGKTVRKVIVVPGKIVNIVAN